jgi:hypothetical protein
MPGQHTGRRHASHKMRAERLTWIRATDAGLRTVPRAVSSVALSVDCSVYCGMEPSHGMPLLEGVLALRRNCKYTQVTICSDSLIVGGLAASRGINHLDAGRLAVQAFLGSNRKGWDRLATLETASSCLGDSKAPKLLRLLPSTANAKAGLATQRRHCHPSSSAARNFFRILVAFFPGRRTKCFSGIY